MKSILPTALFFFFYFVHANALAEGYCYGSDCNSSTAPATNTNPYGQQSNPYSEYCYSWNCDSSKNSIMKKQIYSGTDDENKYGDKAKTSKYSDVMKASKLRSPSTCHKLMDKDKDASKRTNDELDAKDMEKNLDKTRKPNVKLIRNNSLPCVKLY